MRKRKKGKRRWLSVLLAALALLGGAGLGTEKVQAAENVNYLDMSSANGLWNVTNQWSWINSENANLTSLDSSGLYQKANKGAFIYMEAPGILAYPDTTSWIKATYDNIGTMKGRSVSVQVTFRNFHGKKDTAPVCDLLGNPTLKDCVDPEKSAVVLSACFWNGFSQHDIYAMEEDYHFYYTDNGESISCKGAYMTANSLNKGEGIRYYTEGQDGGNLNVYLRSDHQLINKGYGFWMGNSNDFTDDPKADDFTKNSVCFQLCTDDPKFFMSSENCDYWHAFTVSPLGATVPSEPEKTGYDIYGNHVSHYDNIKVGDVLNFDIIQRVQYLSVTGVATYKSFSFTDSLPRELTYVDAYVTDGYGNRLGAGQVNITVNNGKINAAFTEDYLKNGMLYRGEDYILHVSAKVNEFAAGASRFINNGCTTINGTTLDAYPVIVTPAEPALSIEKKASKYEWQVGDTVDYTITVKQTGDGAIANNVRISDTSLPEGLAVSEGEDAITVDYPKTWTDASGTQHQTEMSVQRQGTGFIVTLNRMGYNEPVTIHVKCKAKESANGQKITNTATAQADNVKKSVQDSAEVYINSPKLAINKEVSKYEWQVGDTVDYTIKVDQTVNGCLARNVKISDTSLPEGLAVSDDADAITVDYPKNWTDADGTHQTAVSTTRQGTGFVVTVDGIGYNAPVTVKVKCKAKESANGQKITNTATAQADNVKAAVKDTARVYINSPKLAIHKEVSKYEWRVGDTVDYTITVKQTESGCLAKNVKISDLSLPEGLAVSQDAGAISVDYPKTWTEPESGAVRQTSVSTQRQGNGFIVTLDRLEYNAPVTVKVKCMVTDTVNGNVVVNTVTAQGDNVKTPVKDNAEVYLNSPGVHIQKECDQNYAKVGDLISYTLHVDNWSAGTLARNVVITDEIETDGMKLQKKSIVLLDSDGNPIEDAKITVKGNTFCIETGKTLICPEANYQNDMKFSLSSIEDIQNNRN